MDNDFKYSRKYINSKIKEFETNGYGKAIMAGVHVDLKKLKESVEKLYSEKVFYLSYYASDAPFMGWDASNPEYKAMVSTTDKITNAFLDVYALILVGLGEEMESEI